MRQDREKTDKAESKKDSKVAKRVWGMAFLVLGILGIMVFIYPVMRGCRINIGTMLGTGVFAILAFYGAFKKKIDIAVSKWWKRRSGRICLTVIMVAAVTVFALAAVITGNMVYAANEAPRSDATVVVLGCAVRGGGPSLMLRERLIAAQDYLEETPEAVCVVSGGQGADESISEAQCMYEYLTEHGISPERIYMEDKSTSTRENIKFSAEVIRANGLPDKMNIVTNEFHEYRAKRIADRQGIETGSISGSTAWWLLPTYYVREMAGILYEWISG